MQFYAMQAGFLPFDRLPGRLQANVEASALPGVWVLRLEAVVEAKVVRARLGVGAAEGGLMADDLSIFVCSRFPTTTCQTANCTNRATFTCTAPLAGPKAGTACGRRVCDACRRGTDCCRAHQKKASIPPG